MRTINISTQREAPREKTEAGKMGKKITSFRPGESETDDVVRRWLAGQGIDPANVSGYSIFRHQGEIPRIMLEMYFDDAPPPATPDWENGDNDPADGPTVSRETRPVIDPTRTASGRTYVGERGPEMVPPDYFDSRDTQPGY